MKAKIHSSETLGSVDGPGLRYVIFFQGCNMKCLYCHNRDTWNHNGGEDVELVSIVNKVRSLKEYYSKDHGGVTVSGGEPLIQSQFISELFDEIHQIGLTTALDTSGHIELTEHVKECVDKTDYLLLDVKSLNDAIHGRLTGVNRKLVIPFFDYVRNSRVTVWLRYVYVPGYTDSHDDLIALCDFIKGFNNIERVDILPYHEYGREKWENLGYKYPLDGLATPKIDAVEKFRQYIRENTLVIVK